MSSKTAGRGHTRKHTSASKHTQGRAKHNPSSTRTSHHRTTAAKVHTVGKAAGKTKRGLAIAGLPVCAAEAAAASLALTGAAVSAADILALYGRITDCADAGASILATLEAAYRWGLGGVRPVSFGPVEVDDPAALILGVELPGAHAVAVSGGCWSSWGDWWPPGTWPDAVIEEAWSVTWP